MANIEIPSYRMTVELPVGFKDREGKLFKVAEVRAVTGLDEMYIGMSREYNEHPNDMVYKMLLIGRCVSRLGDIPVVTLSDVQQLHARDVRALEVAIYTLTYGSDALPPQEDGTPGGVTIAYPLHHLRREVAFLAFHLHWSLGEILALAHADRVGWVGEVSRINREILEASENGTR